MISEMMTQLGTQIMFQLRTQVNIQMKTQTITQMKIQARLKWGFTWKLKLMSQRITQTKT